MDKETLRELVSIAENDFVDLKRKLEISSAANKAEFLKDIISLANSSFDRGYLIVGIDDNKTYLGTSDLDEEQIQQVVSTYVSPPIILNLYHIVLSDPTTVNIAVIEVKATNKPHQISRAIDRLLQGDTFVRRGSVISKAIPADIIRMYDESNLNKNSREERLYTQAAIASEKAEDWENAIKAYTKLIESSPKSLTYRSRAKCYSNLLKKYIQPDHLQERYAKQALTDFTSAINLAESIGEIRTSRLARLEFHPYPVYSKIIWMEDANWLVKNAESAQDALTIYQYLEYKIHMDLIIVEESFSYSELEILIPLFARLLELGVKNDFLYVMRAMAHSAMHNYGLAISDLKLAIATCNDKEPLISYLEFLGDCYQKAELFDDAIDAYEKARSLGGEGLLYFGRDYNTIFIFRKTLELEFGNDRIVNQKENLVALQYFYNTWKEKYPFALEDLPKTKAIIKKFIGAETNSKIRK